MPQFDGDGRLAAIPGLPPTQLACIHAGTEHLWTGRVDRDAHFDELRRRLGDSGALAIARWCRGETGVDALRAELHGGLQGWACVALVSGAPSLRPLAAGALHPQGLALAGGVGSPGLVALSAPYVSLGVGPVRECTLTHHLSQAAPGGRGPV